MSLANIKTFARFPVLSLGSKSNFHSAILLAHRRQSSANAGKIKMVRSSFIIIKVG